MAASDKVQLRNKIHYSTVAGKVGSCRDQAGRWAATSCGTRNASTRPSYVTSDREVDCQKCLR